MPAADEMSAGRLVEVEPARWDELLRRVGVTDVYYQRGYVEASAVLGGAEPTFLHLAGEAGDVVFPCLVRSVPVDVVTPYGYGGPLGVGPRPPVAEFAAAYEAWSGERGALTSFVVFHPLFGNAQSPTAAGFHRTALGGTVAWPLADRDLLPGMHKHHRRVVRRALADGLEAAVEPAPADLTGFRDVYEQTMRRTEAAAFYLFPEPYWDALAADVPLVKVDVHRRGGELLASVLGMGKPPWLHYHLGGSTEAGRRTGASHLALFELARWGQEHGFEALHLGGGVGGRTGSLLEFKLRFAPDGLAGSVVGKAVHDRAAYLELAGADTVDWDAFFPAYRAPR